MGRGKNTTNSLAGLSRREEVEETSEREARAWNDFFLYDYPSIEEGSEDMKIRDAAISVLEDAGFSLEGNLRVPSQQNED